MTPRELRALGLAALTRADELAPPPETVRTTPYGWHELSPRLVECPDEADTAQRIVARRAAGAALMPIAQELNDEGIRTRAGAEWSAAAIQRVLIRLTGSADQSEARAHQKLNSRPGPRR